MYGKEGWLADVSSVGGGYSRYFFVTLGEVLSVCIYYRLLDVWMHLPLCISDFAAVLAIKPEQSFRQPSISHVHFRIAVP